MNRAYSILAVKDMTETADSITVRGIASTPSTDRMGDVVDPMGARFKTPMPLLWQHRHDEPVGHVTFARPEKRGIPFEARLPIVKEAGRLKDRVDEAIQSLKYGLITAVSIGFKAVENQVERIDTGLKFRQWEWLELSLVTIPANSEAVITAVKHFDHAPASGQSTVEASPGVTGKQPARKGAVKLIPRTYS